MKKDLILNPYTQVLFKDQHTQALFEVESEAEYLLVAPIPQKELKFTGISKSKHPNLYELFLDLSETQLDYLNIDQDLNAAERDFLYENGVLIESGKAPQKPLFCCLLDDVETEDFDHLPENLIVNPSFRFEPFSFDNLRTWITEKHLSPYQPSVWIECPVSKIRLGYWLNNSQTEIVSRLQAGQNPGSEIPRELLSRLVTAEILIHPEGLEKKIQTQKEIIEQAQKDLAANKYSIFRKLLPAAQMSAMRRFYRQYIEQGFMPFGDTQVKRRFRQVNEPLAKFFHQNFGELMNLIAGETVVPSYVYAASYKEFADLKPHTDRKQCIYSISFQVDYLPETEDFVSPWVLFISPLDFPVSREKPYANLNFPAESQDADTNPPNFLASGDALFYKGCEVIHYRYPLPARHQSTSLFFHYVPEDFDEDLLPK